MNGVVKTSIAIELCREDRPLRLVNNVSIWIAVIAVCFI